jgi:hypothetical protein
MHLPVPPKIKGWTPTLDFMVENTGIVGSGLLADSTVGKLSDSRTSG